jgi:2-polyprenyl-3-methyl-5-hydroxy-6-metoxy-1,4-benzoquinol methylase
VEFLHPQPDDAVLASIYGPDYFLGGEGEGTERVARMKAATAQRYLECMTQRLKTDQRRLLEIGCGAGELLVQAQQKGFEVRGIEFSSSSVAVANSRLGRTAVEAGTLETMNIPRQHFDVVVGCDVVEHVRDPQAFLARVYECLKPGGMVFLITPSPDSLSRKLLGRHWMEYKTEHLFYFSKASLNHMLSAAGFQRAEFSANKKVLSLDYVTHHFQRFSVPVISGLLRTARAVLPDQLAFRHFTIPASGVLALAWKPVS